MDIEKALEREKGRILRPEHVIEAMEICHALANYGPESPSPLKDKVNLINAAQSLMKKMEEAEKKHLLLERKQLENCLAPNLRRRKPKGKL